MAGFSNSMGKWYSGLLGDTASYNYIEAQQNEDGNGIIPYGAAVWQGAEENTVIHTVIVSQAAASFAGLAVKNNDGMVVGEADGYRELDTVDYIRRGKLVCAVSVTDIVGKDREPVFVDLSDPDLRLTNVSTNNLAIPAVFRSNESGGCAMVELSPPSA